MKINTKNSAVDLTDLAIGIIVLGIVVTIGATILLNLQSNRLTDLTVVTTRNETTPALGTGDNLANAYFKSIISVVNASNGTDVVPATNYTVTTSPVSGIGNIAFSGSKYNGTNVNVSYDWYNTSSRADYNLAGDAATGIAEYGNWFQIIVIVGVAAVVLTLIFMAFGNRGDSGGVSY